MASVQCYKTCQETCQQKTTTHQSSSFGQKVSDMFKGHHNGATTQTQCHSQCRGDNHHTACSFFRTHTTHTHGYGAANNHHNNNGGATQTQCHSQCRGSNHHTSCSYFRTNTHTHTQGHVAANNHNNGCSKTHTHTQSCGGTKHHNNGGGYGMTTKTSETDYFHSETKTTTANSASGRCCSNGTSKKEHKSGGMFQKIKNKLSGDSDSSSSSSDSESDSDNENKCRRRSARRKNCN